MEKNLLKAFEELGKALESKDLEVFCLQLKLDEAEKQVKALQAQLEKWAAEGDARAEVTE